LRAREDITPSATPKKTKKSFISFGQNHINVPSKSPYYYGRRGYIKMGQNSKIEENIKELYLLTEILTYIMKEQEKEELQWQAPSKE
jgi:hypothetical protein